MLKKIEKAVFIISTLLCVGMSISVVYALQEVKPKQGSSVITGPASQIGIRKWTEAEVRQYEETEKTIRALKFRAQQFRNVKNYDLAIKTYQEIVPMIKGTFWYYGDINSELAWMAECYLLKGEEKTAIEMYHQAIWTGVKSNPQTENSSEFSEKPKGPYGVGADWFAYAFFLNKSGKQVEALSFYNNALLNLKREKQLDDSYVPSPLTGNEGKMRQEATMYLAAGIAYFEAGIQDCASYFLEIAIQKLPDSALVNYYYGQLWDGFYDRDKVSYASREKVKIAYTKAAKLGRGELKVVAQSRLDSLTRATSEEYWKANRKPLPPFKRQVQPASSSFPVTPGYPAPVGTPTPPPKP